VLELPGTTGFGFCAPRVIELKWEASTMNAALSAAAKLPLVACSWNAANESLSILHPAKVAMPVAAFTGFCVQVSVAVGSPVPLVMDRVTGTALLVTVLPPASCTVTAGWVLKGTPNWPPLFGFVVKASLAAGPTVTLKLELVAPVNPVVLAASV
jgi:hypothetical protein